LVVIEPTVGFFVDYESPLARVVASNVWAGLSRTALKAGYTRTTARWESLRESPGAELSRGLAACLFAVGQDRPDAVDAIEAVGASRPRDAPKVYGIVVAVPDRPSPLAGSLLYQGVERLTRTGIRAGDIEPALLHPVSEECERYAQRLLERLESPAG
jgi:hypothetical protein